MRTVAVTLFAFFAASLLWTGPSFAEAVSVMNGRMIEDMVVVGNDDGISVNIRVYDPLLAKVFKKPAASAKNAQRSKKVQLYMTTWCPYCQKMEQFLIAAKIPYSKYNIEGDRLAFKRYKDLGGSGIPFLVIGETTIEGYDPDGVRTAWEWWN